jgi:hypothetical protein
LAEWEQTHGKKKAKYALTSTGLLMEGVSQVPRGGSPSDSNHRAAPYEFWQESRQAVVAWWIPFLSRTKISNKAKKMVNLKVQ